MYTDDNEGWLAPAYPIYGNNNITWCAGNADTEVTGGTAGSYGYAGPDPAGIQRGVIWPYTKSLGVYTCPADNRVATKGEARFIGKTILRSISMNSFLNASSYGANPDWVITSPKNAMDPNNPVYRKESEISKPAKVWLTLDEDPKSINDGMFLVDVGGQRKFLDLPARTHSNGYGINFMDGHAETYYLRDRESITWVAGQPGGVNDWRKLVSVTTNPQSL
jgi:hypothetical protein